jgi:hypothetical protein
MSRGITVLTPDGPRVVIIPGRADRGRIARHWYAVDRYVDLGDFRLLQLFEGVTVRTADGERLELVTDLATIDRLAAGGELHRELYSS